MVVNDIDESDVDKLIWFMNRDAPKDRPPRVEINRFISNV
jgi:hypothetical protein